MNGNAPEALREEIGMRLINFSSSPSWSPLTEQDRSEVVQEQKVMRSVLFRMSSERADLVNHG